MGHSVETKAMFTRMPAFLREAYADALGKPPIERPFG